MIRKALIPTAFLLIIIAAGLISNNNIEKAEVINSSIPETDNVKIYERPAGGWEVYWLVYDPKVDANTPSGVDPESIQVTLNGIDITEEVEIKLVKEDPAYRISINRYWAPGEYNITLVVSDYAGNRAIYKYILVFR